MAMDFDWNDIRAFLALARTQRLVIAARQLGIDHSTLSRRINALETSLKTRLFDRHVTGHTLTPEGMRLLERSEAMESLAIGIVSSISANDDAFAGPIRLATPEGFGTSFLAPRLAGLTEIYPEMEIELIANPGVVSLPKREADLAVMMARPEKGRLHARKLTDYELGLYASRTYLEKHPPVITRADLDNHLIIGYIDDLLPTEHHAYLGEIFEKPHARIRVSNIMTQVRITREGAGICILPCFMASEHDNLIRLFPKEIAIRRAYWLVVHEEVRSPARNRAVSDFLAKMTAANRKLFLPDAN